MLLRLHLVSPATNIVSERSTSTMRRIKNWLHSTMSQERLNHVILLSIHKERTDKIDLTAIANMFFEENDKRQCLFRAFCIEDLKLP